MADLKFVWFDQKANARRLHTPDGVARVVERCAYAGITDILLNVRNPGGLGLYRSHLVPHRSEVFDDYPPGYDLLGLTLEAAHRVGLRVHAAPDVFAGGYGGDGHPAYVANRRPEWRAVTYGLDPELREPRLCRVVEGDLLTAAPLDRKGAVFLNPGLPEVREYAVQMLEELAREYPIDGFCLDRGRYDSLNTDFSEATRVALGVSAAEWPQAVFTIVDEVGLGADGKVADRYSGVAAGVKCLPGPAFGAWLEYRAETIRSFFVEARRRVKAIRPELRFGDYVGSWYPLYWQVGVNWGSQRYDPQLPWAGPGYAATGYAEQLDYLTTGCYYPEITVAEARAKGAVDWYSVEGAAQISVEAVMGDTPVAAGIYLLHYRNDVERYKEAVRMCRARSAGVMLFDLCYLDDFNWWDATREVLR